MERNRKSTAVVIKHTGSRYVLSELPEWNLFDAVARGKLRLKDNVSTNPVAVGDMVEYSLPLDENGAPAGDAVIVSVLPRKNYVIRRSTNLSRQCHVIAANLDHAFLIVTMDKPDTKWQFIDRFLVTCEAYKIPVTIVLNKSDLYEGDEYLENKRDLFHSIYSDAGYRLIDVSAVTGQGVEELRNALPEGGVSLFAGVSGVGKSSLIKALDPSLNPKTAEISDKYGQGRHTTTFYEIYPLCNGYTIDSPGLRGFGLIDIGTEEISTYFPEMLRIADGCRYKPCTHTHEPGCAIVKAVEEGTVSAERYYSYLGMLEEEGKYR